MIKEEKKPELFTLNIEDKKTIARLEQTISDLKIKTSELEAQIVKLKKALQESIDREGNLKLQIQEYQVYHNEKEKQTQVAQPKAPSSTSSFFQGSTPPKSQPVRDERNLNLLLKWVVEGHLEEAEKLLKPKPELAIMEGNIKDLSGREFKGITALQYAHWALDAEMMEVIIKYMDKNDAFPQIKTFESNPAQYSAYGVHYDNSVLVKKMEEYLNNYQKWSREQCEKYWQKEIGGAQRMYPAWLIYAMCEEGSDVAWTQKDEKRKVVRQYDKEHLKWWFEHEDNEGKLGYKWAALRGMEVVIRGCVRPTRMFGGFYSVHDREVHGRIEKQSVKAVDDLKTQLTVHVTGQQAYQEGLNTQQKAPSGTSSFFKESQLPKSQPVRDEENWNLLLKWVVEGHLEEAEKLLKSTPNLVLMKGDVKDLSSREFKGITALQYAYWALDAEMMEVVVKYIDKNDALTQIKTFESNLTYHLPATCSTRGMHYDNSVLMKKMEEYLKHCEKWSYDQCCSYWQKEVGGAQRMCPAWLVYAMCEEGENVAWTKKDEKRKVVRRYEKDYLKWWFDQEYKGGKLGGTWAALRGCMVTPVHIDLCSLVRIYSHDHECHGRFGKQSVKAVDDLKTQLMTSHYTMGKVGKE